jgi:hypothetical protein
VAAATLLPTTGAWLARAVPAPATSVAIVVARAATVKDSWRLGRVTSLVVVRLMLMADGLVARARRGHPERRRKTIQRPASVALDVPMGL